jgi:hypothetical protein
MFLVYFASLIDHQPFHIVRRLVPLQFVFQPFLFLAASIFASALASYLFPLFAELQPSKTALTLYMTSRERTPRLLRRTTYAPRAALVRHLQQDCPGKRWPSL